MMGRKGGNNEREKAKDIGLWWSEGEDDDIFWRDNSGARATTRAKVGKSTSNSYGDLIVKDPSGEAFLRICTVELKKGYNSKLDLLDLLDGKGDPDKIIFQKFWNQVTRDAEKAQKNGWGENPLLIIHRDRKRPLIAMTRDFFSKLDNYYGNSPIPRTRIYGLDIVILRLEDFYSWCDAEFFKLEWSKKCQNLQKKTIPSKQSRHRKF